MYDFVLLFVIVVVSGVVLAMKRRQQRYLESAGVDTLSEPRIESSELFDLTDVHDSQALLQRVAEFNLTRHQGEQISPLDIKLFMLRVLEQNRDKNLGLRSYLSQLKQEAEQKRENIQTVLSEAELYLAQAASLRTESSPDDAEVLRQQEQLNKTLELLNLRIENLDERLGSLNAAYGVLQQKLDFLNKLEQQYRLIRKMKAVEKSTQNFTFTLEDQVSLALFQIRRELLHMDHSLTEAIDQTQAEHLAQLPADHPEAIEAKIEYVVAQTEALSAELKELEPE